MIDIEPFKRYNKKEVCTLLELNEEQIKLAESKKYIVFFDGCVYGILLFQFIRDFGTQLEKINKGLL